MIKQMTLSDELAQRKTKKKELLNRIDRIVPWGEWIKLIEPHYYKGEWGNKPYDKELMLRLAVFATKFVQSIRYANNKASNRQPSIFRFL